MTSAPEQPDQVFIHPNALCETTAVGPRTRVWAFAHILAGARIGADCNVCDGVFVENDVRVGDRVTVKSGVQLWDGVELEDDVFVGPNATFTNDRFPRSRVHPEEYSRTTVRRGASIGANATILPGLEIGAGAMIGAGAVVTRSVPANAIAVGNPARITGYVGTDTHPRTPAGEQVELGRAPHPMGVGRATVHELPFVRDLRGSLTVAEFKRDLPFRPERCFLVFDVPGREVRGEHAHRHCQQFLICVRGSVTALVDDGVGRAQVVLDRPTLGLHVPAMIWSTQYAYSADALLLVFASQPYDPTDYIRDYRDYLASIASQTVVSRPT